MGPSCQIRTPDVKASNAAAGDASTAVTVLLVEDEAALRELLVEVLTECGYRVLDASNGSEALAMTSAASATIDVLVTDVRMPGMGGPELAANARSLLPNLRVLYMSGYTDHRLFHENLTGSEAHFIQKPFAAEDLCARIASLVRT